MKALRIICCICTDDSERLQMIKKVLVKKGLASTPGDAAKLIKPNPSDFDAVDSYYIAASLYNLKSSDTITNQLYRMAASGILVVVGLKKLQPEYEFMCESYYQGQI